MINQLIVGRVLDSKFSRDSSLSHLRRFAKHTQLPETLHSIIPEHEHSSQTIFVLISPPIPDLDTLQTLLAPFALAPLKRENEKPPPDDAKRISFFPLRIPLQPPLNARQAEKWTKAMWPVIFNPAAPRANIAPPPQILNRTLESVQPRAGYYLALAQELAHEAEQSGLGRRVGAVIVDPAIETTLHHTDTGEKTNASWTQAIVAVAGDARYTRRDAGAGAESDVQLGSGPNPASRTYNADLEGGPELHALMRVVDMVARRRREDDGQAAPDNADLSPLESHFLYQSAPATADCTEAEILPVPGKYQKTDIDTAQSTKTAIESTSRIRPRALGGYLCTDLDVYLSREPCLCCSMGMLLSRFRAVIFPRKGRMVTGGLASEPVVSPTLQDDDEIDTQEEAPEAAADKDKSRDPRNNRKYYGLHWRKELNWRALGFEFVEDGYLPGGMGIEGEDGIAFHA